MSLLKRNLAANFVGQAWIAVMGLIFIPVYIRYLGMEAYGLIGMFAVLLTVFNLLDLGLTATLKREMARFTAGNHTPESIRDLLRSVEVFCFVLAALACAIVWAGSGALAAGWLHIERLPVAVVADAIAWMAVVVALRFVEGIYKGAIIGLQDQVRYNIVAAGISTFRNAGVILVLAFVAPTITVFFIWQGLVSVVSVLIYAATLHRLLPEPARPARFTPAALASVGGYAGGTLAITVLAMLLTQVDKILLLRLLPLAVFGHYALATAVSSKLTSIISPITQAVFPNMVELVDRKQPVELASRYHQGAQLVTVLTAPVALALVFFAEGIVLLWSNDAELASRTAPLLSLLSLSVFLNGLMWMPYQCALAHGWTSLGVKANLLAVLVLVPALAWVVPRHGAVGAAAVKVGLNAVYLLASAHFLHRRILRGEKWHWYFRDLMLPTLGALAVMAAFALLRPDRFLARWDWLPYLALACTLALAAAAALAPEVRHRGLALLRKARPA
jgi:O-antigen/teichoic acid export membrane protein